MFPLLVCALQVEVQTIDGQQYRGVGVAIAQDRLILTDQEGAFTKWNKDSSTPNATTQRATDASDKTEAESLPLERVLRIDVRGEVPHSLPSTAQIWLRDGSVVCIDSLAYDGSIVRAVPAMGRSSASVTAANDGVTAPRGSLELAPWQVSAVRLSPPSPERDSQWSEIQAQQHAGDVLVIRKAPTALDYLEGVIVGIDADTLLFEFDGEKIDVPLQKLEGFLFYLSQPEPMRSPRASVTLVDGSIWRLDTVSIDGGWLQALTSGGEAVQFPLEQVKQIDLAAGKVAYLSDLEPASVEITPKFGSALQAALNRLIYAPKRDAAIGGGPLRLRDPATGAIEQFAKGLALHSRSRLEYRLAGEYRRLRGIAGMAPEINVSGAVRLQIAADQETLWDRVIRTSDGPIALDLDLTGKRRLAILVDFVDDLDVADRLNLCELRIIK